MVTILSIIILERPNFPDIVSLETDLPEPIYPFKGKLFANFNCARGTARQFVAEHFRGIPVKVIATEEHSQKFSDRRDRVDGPERS